MNTKIILLFLFAAVCNAQFNSNISFSSYYDDNLFRSPFQSEDIVSDMDITLGYKINNTNFEISYNPDFIFFTDFSERNFSTHSVGFNYLKPLNKSGLNTFYIGADYTKRINKDIFNFYDYNQYYAYLNARFDLDLFFLKIGYNFRNREYSNFTDLTNYQHYIFAQMNKAFPTRTSVIVEADLGNKSFEGYQTLTSVYKNYDSNYGYGGRGKGMGSGEVIITEDTTYTTVTRLLEKPKLNHIVLLARVAQSLHTKLGIFVQYRQQISLTDQTNYMNSDAYFQDEEIFDDPFSYESQGFSSQLTWIMPLNVKFQLGGGYTSKQYISEKSYISAEDSVASGPVREDQRSFIYLNLSKTINFNKSWINNLDLSLNFNYGRNESNSYWYDYKNSVFGGGITWKF
jgi:hypothetical protein